MGVSIDTAASGLANDATALSWNHTVVAGDPVLLSVSMVFRSSVGVSDVAITYNGVALAPYAVFGATLRYHEIWALHVVGDGAAHAVSVTWAGASAAVGGSLSFLNASELYGADTVLGSTIKTLQLIIPSDPNDLVVGVCQHISAEGTSPGADETEQWDRQSTLAGVASVGAGYTQPGAASVSLDPSWVTAAAARLSGYAVRATPSGKKTVVYSFPGPKSVRKRADRHAYY